MTSVAPRLLRSSPTGATGQLSTRCGADVEQRLLQTSPYRPDLDLVVVDRTEDDHQRRRLARHVLTTGIDLLARAGAARIKIIFEHDNAAARNLYLGVGFEPVKQTVIASGRTDAGRHPS